MLAAALVAAGLVLSSQGAGERIERFESVVLIEDDGDLVITERIAYDFGAEQRRGILRHIPVEATHDDRYDRRYPLEVLSVSSPTAPDQHVTERVGADLQLRIGNPDVYIHGVHVYEIAYRVEAALNGFDDHVELYWNITGTGWPVPIDDVSVRVEAPAAVDDALCFAGPQGSSLGCDRAAVEGDTATFGHSGLGSYEGVTVVVGLPLGAVPDPQPVLEERFSLDRAFSRTPATLGLAGLALVLSLLLVVRQAWRTGRDRRAVGSAIDHAFAEHGAEDEPVPLLGRGEVPVEFAPPDRLLPGQLGLLVDEVAHTHDVTATIVDLATKGWLRIEQVGEDGWFSKPDWRLVRLRHGTDGLLHYEAILLESLFELADEDGSVLLSDLKERFASHLSEVREAMYEDAIERHWFRGRPDRVRTMWAVGGAVLAAACLGLTALVAANTTFGLVPLALVPAGLLAAAVSPRMGARTARGTAVLQRALGFKRFIDESEKRRAEFAEQQHLFTEYLPYAVAFGATERWANAFAGLSTPPPQPSWYVGHPGTMFNVATFGSSIQSFATSTTGTIASTPSASGGSGFGGGGFSGGGGGGGGGGSW